MQARSIGRVPGETEPDEVADESSRTRAGAVSDTATLGPEERVIPTWTEPLARAGSAPIGGPLGVHAAIGRHWFWTPLRVALLIAVIGLAIGWFGKAACVQQYYNEDEKKLESGMNNLRDAISATRGVSKDTSGPLSVARPDLATRPGEVTTTSLYPDR